MAKYEIIDGVGIIPQGVTTIEYEAFMYCEDLKTIIIPDSVTTIEPDAFYYCGSLTNISIPNSVATIDSNVFIGSNLESIVVEKENPIYDSRNNCNAIIETATNTLVCGCSTTIIPDSVTKIGPSAFEDCTGLTSMVIPNSVTEIGSNAFSNCNKLKRIVIPDSVTHINKRIFYNCSALDKIYVYESKKDFFKAMLEEELHNKIVENYEIVDGVVVIQEGVSKIEREAFKDCCNVKSVVIPDSITEIGEYALYGCCALKKIYVSKGKKDYFKRLLPTELHDKIVER